MAVLIPISITAFSQFEFVQTSRCVLAELPWGVGRCDVMADLIAPVWAIAIIPIAVLLRRLIPIWGRAPVEPEGWFMTRFATEAWTIRATWIATWGAVLIVVLGYTREWERFNQQPGAVVYLLVVISVFAMLLVPVWWMRSALHERGARFLSEGSAARKLDTYLFDEPDPQHPARWSHVVAFSLVAAVVALTVLGQFNSLLQGMNLPEAPSSGMGSISAIFELDLSQKPDAVLERVGAWKDYTEAVGGTFGSPYTLVVAHVVGDTFGFVPAYLVAGLTLLMLAWRNRSRLAEGSAERKSYELIILGMIGLLGFIVITDLFENGFLWYVVDRAWRRPDLLTDANVRILWFLSFTRFVAMVLAGAGGIILVALGRLHVGGLRHALISVRAELLVLTLLVVAVLVPPQMSDVIRGWQVTHVSLALALVIALSMTIRWSAASTLRLQRGLRADIDSGRSVSPRRVRVPWIGATPTIGTALAGSVLGLTALQVLLTAGFGLPTGLGLVVPALMILVLWVLGIAMPPSPYERGDREFPEALRRRLPKLLGSFTYVILGVAVLKAAAGSIVSARHEDLYLLLALVPPLIGLWRIHTRSTSRMGILEVAFLGIVVVLAGSLMFAGNPELSPAALSFTGVSLAFGAMAYVNSYAPESVLSRLTTKYVRRVPARPALTLALVVTLGSVLGLLVDPIGFAPRIGSVGILLLTMILVTLIGVGAIRFAELSRPPRILSAFRVRRTPMVTLIVLWVLLAPTLTPRSINNIRVLETETVAAAGANVGVSDVWQRWALHNLDGSGPTQVGADRPVVPLLLVSSSSGGLRAAVWTALVLDCILETTGSEDGPCSVRLSPSDANLSSSVAIMSGVSGGALGFATYASYLIGRDAESTGDWVEEALGDDYLAPPLGWLIFFDLPRSLLGFGAGFSNRSDILERAWEASSDKGTGVMHRGLRDLWESEPELPPMIFNGASVNDGCRFNASILDLDGRSPDVSGCAGAGVVSRAGSPETGGLAATYDLVDFLCEGQDVRLSTAVLLSARVPGVSTTGRVAGDPTEGCRSRRSNAVYVVDGIYQEGSGAGTLLDVWEALSGAAEAHNSAPTASTCIVPFMVHIDNGYESPSITPRDVAPREMLVPLIALYSAQTGRIVGAREKAAITFDEPFTISGSPVRVQRIGNDTNEIDSRYTRLVTRAHPGVQAPLGWTLSQASIDDLRSQLEIQQNLDALAEVRSWLDGEMVCSVGESAD